MALQIESGCSPLVVSLITGAPVFIRSGRIRSAGGESSKAQGRRTERPCTCRIACGCLCPHSAPQARIDRPVDKRRASTRPALNENVRGRWADNDRIERRGIVSARLDA